ncbi:hypothetical protein [Bacillus sp. FSL K6-3431]|uniref:hypothetical protein n=1 Tax=Bacillus sp. FSL K6-3431 TaxID=2921500 RepID=UPI0030FAC42F
MAKVKVEVTGAVVDGNAPGSTIEIDASSAKALEANGYVRILKEKPKPAPVKKESAPKKPTAKAKVTKTKKNE